MKKNRCNYFGKLNWRFFLGFHEKKIGEFLLEKWTPRLVLHVLCPSRMRLIPQADCDSPRLVLHVLCPSRMRLIPQADCDWFRCRLPNRMAPGTQRWSSAAEGTGGTTPPSWLWSESEKKWKKWCKKGSLFFLKLIYIIYYVYTFSYFSIKMCRQLSYGFEILKTFGDPTKKIKNTIFTWFF